MDKLLRRGRNRPAAVQHHTHPKVLVVRFPVGPAQNVRTLQGEKRAHENNKGQYLIDESIQIYVYICIRIFKELKVFAVYEDLCPRALMILNKLKRGPIIKKNKKSILRYIAL